jgi:threonine dehydratase
LVPAPGLEATTGFPIYLKLENKHATGAFKMRGALTAVRRLSPEQREAGVLTYSSGNHGQALAFAAQRMGIRAVVVMPETAPKTKVEGVKRWGGTAGLEIVEQLPEVAHVVFPVGGGGLAAGVTTALSALRPETKLTGVEPEGAAAFGAALHAGHPVRLEKTQSIADGLLPLSVGTITFNHLRGRADAVTVSETAIAFAAAIRTGAIKPNGPTVLIVSGGNVDDKALEDLAKFEA